MKISEKVDEQTLTIDSAIDISSFIEKKTSE